MGKFLAKLIKWVLFIAGIVLILFLAFGWDFWGLIPSRVVEVQVPVEVEKIVEKTVEVEVPAECPTCPVCETAAPIVPVVVPDTIQKFRDLGNFYIDGDQFIENWKVQGTGMKYTCQYNGGVYISMDPGVVNSQSTGDLGAVFYVTCKIGDVITLSTPHWSDSAKHQQVHLVEFTQEISENQALNFLKVLKVDEGKQIAYFIDSEGKVTTH